MSFSAGILPPHLYLQQMQKMQGTKQKRIKMVDLLKPMPINTACVPRKSPKAKSGENVVYSNTGRKFVISVESDTSDDDDADAKKKRVKNTKRDGGTAAKTQKTSTVHTGPRGGKYTITNGKKRYL